MDTNINPVVESVLPMFLIDSDDAEGWLIEEGIAYRDKSGNLNYGINFDDPSLGEDDPPSPGDEFL